MGSSKAAVIENDWYLAKLGAARPLMRQIVGLIGDKSQPSKLRLEALEDIHSRGERRDAIRKTVSDPGDGMRLDIAGRYCEYRDILEEVANHGDEATFANALRCLDGHAGKLGGIDFHKHLSEWSSPGPSAGLESPAEPKRRAKLESRLRCLLGQALCPVSLALDPG